MGHLYHGYVNHNQRVAIFSMALYTWTMPFSAGARAGGAAKEGTDAGSSGAAWTQRTQRGMVILHGMEFPKFHGFLIFFDGDFSGDFFIHFLYLFMGYTNIPSGDVKIATGNDHRNRGFSHETW